MAIVQMQRINICALKKNRKAILERLQELGAMEIDIQLEDDNLGEKQDVASSRALFERRAQTADQALAILNTYVPEKKACWIPWQASRWSRKNCLRKQLKIRISIWQLLPESLRWTSRLQRAKQRF